MRDAAELEDVSSFVVRKRKKSSRRRGLGWIAMESMKCEGKQRPLDKALLS
jgi:hypothetical protein